MPNPHSRENPGELVGACSSVVQSEHRYRDLLESTSDRIWEVDERLCYIYVSPKVADLLGYQPEELLGKTPFDFMPPFEVARLRKQIEELLRQPKSFQTLENVHLHKDGSLRTLETGGVPVFDGEGRCCGVRGVDRDITERKKAELEIQAALARSAVEQARSEAIVAAIGEGLIIVDTEFKVLYQNQILEDLYGDREDDHCYVVFADRDKICDNCPVAQTFLDGGIHSVEKSATKDGRTVYREMTASPLRDATGTIIGAVELVRDISERKRAEHALKQSERQLKEVQRIANLGSWQFDYGTGQLAWSDQTYRILGWTPGEIPASYKAFLEGVHPEDRDQLRLRYRESMRAGSDSCDNEHRIVRKLGAEIRHVHQKCEHLRDESGRVIRSYGMIHDITSRKEAEESIRTLNADLSARAAELETVNKDLEAFSYTVSHDLRGPLTNINSYCQAIAELGGDRLDSQCAGFLDSVFLEVRRMDELITSLLNLSRFTHLKLKKERVDLSEMAIAVAAELQIREPGRRVEFDIMDGVSVSGDRKLLRMVLVNLFGNAWKFSSQSENPVIRFGMDQSQGCKVYFVSDNGVGFEMSQSDKIFAVFQRLHPSNDFEGFGIGLTTARRIIERHEGRIWAEGVPGNGAKFSFTLHEKTKSPSPPRPSP